MRLTEETPWHPVWLGNPIYAFLLQSFFQWGTALQELESEKMIRGEKDLGRSSRTRSVASFGSPVRRRSRTT